VIRYTNHLPTIKQVIGSGSLICTGAVIENGLNLNDDSLKSVKGDKFPTQDFLQSQLSQPNQPLPEPPKPGNTLVLCLVGVPDEE